MKIEKSNFDLMTTVEYGGCSAKLAPKELSELLGAIPLLKDKNIMVDIESHDDAGVYRLNDDTALIVTTDFFPPVCSDPYTFGEIAAANSLSDVYAMGGTPLLALNINMFPSQNIPLEVLRDILLGGQSKINEAGAFTMGGHTIDDATPKYGLAVTGTVHPDKLVTNSGAKVGQKLILTKPLGTGVILAARRLSMCTDAQYEEALSQMKLLNKKGGELLQKYGVKGATDITGFGLLGHAMKMAEASGVTMSIDSKSLPLMEGVSDLLDDGCIPGAAFRNMEFVKHAVQFSAECTTIAKMAATDAQTSGGLFIAVDREKADALLSDLHNSGLHPQAAMIGEVIEKAEKEILFN